VFVVLDHVASCESQDHVTDPQKPLRRNRIEFCRHRSTHRQ
jgi:hypothetical protein